MRRARKLVAEALGTGLLVAAVVGPGIMADRLTDDIALALMANPIATGGALLVLITCLGPVSGAHFIPAVASAGLILTTFGALRAGANVAKSVAAYILPAYWFTASTSFANPAVALARSMTDSFAGISPASLAGCWGVQLAGGLLGLVLAHWLFAKEKPPA